MIEFLIFSFWIVIILVALPEIIKSEIIIKKNFRCGDMIELKSGTYRGFYATIVEMDYNRLSTEGKPFFFTVKLFNPSLVNDGKNNGKIVIISLNDLT